MMQQRHKRISISHLRKNLPRKCFYTGLPLTKNKKHKPDPLGFSLEHLISKVLDKERQLPLDKNIVPCCRLINSMIGDAPLKVKFALKEHFKTVIFMPNMPKSLLIKTINNLTCIFLKNYKYKNYYPWEWNNLKNNNNKRIMVYKAYLDLLTVEELNSGYYKKWENYPS